VSTDRGLWLGEWRKVLIPACLMLLGVVRPAAGCLSDGRYVMGTVLEITLCAPATSQNQDTIAALFATATRFDALLTTISPDSLLSRLNAHAGLGPQPMPPEVTDILSQSLRYWRLTEGTFDVTIGPLMALWRQAQVADVLPSPAAVQQVRAQVGSDKIRVSPAGAVSLVNKGMALDLGGIGKGYALDRLVDVLKGQRFTSALLDFGQSSIWALGQPPDAEGWRLLVRQPNGGSVGIITVRNQALSVSGSFGQYFTVDGQRYGHIIDPRTGVPLQRDLLACVIAPSAAQAEALSKALLILGEHKGISLLQHHPGVEGLLVEVTGQQWMTKGWTQAVAFIANE
jgi:FAD:protein FMN transferase